MSQKIVVRKGHATCPNCHEEFDVISKVNGEGSRPQGDAHIRKITKGIKVEILCVYLDNPVKFWTTREIIDRINMNRPNSNQIERSNLTRAHSELVDAGILKTEYKEGYDSYYSINIDRANALLSGE